MRILYIECAMGAAGDMLMGALSELIDDADEFVSHMNGMGLKGVKVEREQATRCGIVGTHMRVLIDGLEEHEHDRDEAHEHIADAGHEHEHDHGHDHDHDHEHDHGLDHGHDHDHDHGHDHGHNHEHGHAHNHHHEHAHHHVHTALTDVAAAIDALAIAPEVKRRADEAYALIAQAEAHAHGRPVEQVHFHEVGAADAIADVVGVCELIERIAPDRIVVSPINLGSGMTRCAHGMVPVPAPATAYILRGVPVYGSAIRGELCTPTGAALLRMLADDFGPMPLMRIEAIGYGCGTKEFPAANCVRAYLGEAE